jgi:hypothetical protein
MAEPFRPGVIQICPFQGHSSIKKIFFFPMQSDKLKVTITGCTLFLLIFVFVDCQKVSLFSGKAVNLTDKLFWQEA